MAGNGMHCISSVIAMQPVTHRRGMDGPPERARPTGIPRRKEPPRRPGARPTAVGRQVADLSRRGATQEGGECCSGIQLLIPERIGSPMGRIGRWDEPQVPALAWTPTWRRNTCMGSWGSRSPPAAHGRVVHTISGGLLCNAHSCLGVRE